MQRISTATRFQDKFGPGKDGFRDGDPGLGTASTQLEALWFDNAQEEIANAIELEGIALNPNDMTQLWQAIRGGYVRKSGDTMTGGLTSPYLRVDNPTISAVGLFRPPGVEAHLGGFVNELARWIVILGTDDAETGGNAGSDFQITRYNDAGVGIDAPFVIERATGNIVCTGAMTAASFTATTAIANPGFDLMHMVFATLNGQTHVLQSIFVTGVWSGMRLAVADSAALFDFRANDEAYKTGGGPWGDSSDGRIKTVLGDYASGLDAIKALRPVRYVFKGNDTYEPPSHYPTGRIPDEDDAPSQGNPQVPYPNSFHFGAATRGKEYIGLVAQEAEVVMPEMITKRRGFIDGVAMTDVRDMDSNALVYALVNAIKEVAARLDALEART